jgi:small subunit ribosomal protein S18
MSKGRSEGSENSSYGSSNVPVVRNVFFRRSRGCPLEGVTDLELDYKNVELLSRYVSERGRIMPSRISSISAKKQRKLALAIKRARMLALMPFVEQ